MTRSSHLLLAMTLGLLLAAPSARAAEPAPPVISTARSQAIAELGRCKRVAYLNKVGRERLSEFLSGKEALRNIDDMTRMQQYDRVLDSWVEELMGAFGAQPVIALMPPLRPEDTRFLESKAYSEPEARAMVDATAREANVCQSNQDKLQAMLAAP